MSGMMRRKMERGRYHHAIMDCDKAGGLENKLFFHKPDEPSTWMRNLCGNSSSSGDLSSPLALQEFLSHIWHS
jgi:hypothetical protein